MVATVISVTPPQMRGEGLAGLFLGAYVGLAIPAAVLGVATLWGSMQVAVLGFAIAATAAVLMVARRAYLANPPPACPQLSITYDHFHARFVGNAPT